MGKKKKNTFGKYSAEYLIRTKKKASFNHKIFKQLGKKNRHSQQPTPKTYLSHSKINESGCLQLTHNCMNSNFTPHVQRI